MDGYKNIKRACSFYVSSMHLVTMLLPYINKQLNLNIGFSTFLEYNLNENVEQVLSKLMSEKNNKEKMLAIDWSTKNAYKFSNIEKEIKNKLNKNKELDILIVGDEKYIKVANDNLERFFIKNSKKLKQKYITIMDCYEVTDFNDNIKEILDTHDVILNTSGMHDISEVFDGYKKKVAN